MEKECRKFAPKSSSRRLSNFLKTAKKPFLNFKYLEKGLSKNGKMLTWFFHLHSVPFYWQDYEKQNRYGTSYQCLLGWKTCLEKFLFSDLSLGQFLMI